QGMVVNSCGVISSTVCPIAISSRRVDLSVRTTPLTCGSQASVTIRIFIGAPCGQAAWVAGLGEATAIPVYGWRRGARRAQALKINQAVAVARRPAVAGASSRVVQ